MRISMIGAGYVGLVSGACFAEFGVEVVCVDQDRRKIEALKAGEVPIYEPELEELVQRNAAAGRLAFTADLAQAVRRSEVVFIAVGTPSRRGDGHADLSFVLAAAEDIARALDRYTLVVTKSTVPVGTSRKVAQVIRAIRPGAEFDMASNPEFLREGSAIGDFLRPDRVVIGVDSERARDILQSLYRPLYLIETPIVITGLETAELIKYAANAFLATKVTFINEMAELCERVGADVHDLARAIGLDGRIGPKFLHPGPGFGGSCLPKDTQALVRIGEEWGARQRIVEAVVDINARRKAAIAERIVRLCGGALAGKTIAVLGVTFKPNTDDVREAASLAVIPALQRAGARVRAYDPKGIAAARALIEGVEWCDGAYAPLDGADAAVILTEWNEFRALDLARVKRLLARPLVIDLRNIYRPEEMRAAGFTYHSVGRPPVLA